MGINSKDPMENLKIEYEGQIYIRANNKWVNENYRVAPSAIQSTLNQKFFSEENLKNFSAGRLMQIGAIYKNTSSEHLAIICFKKALEKDNGRLLKYILPMLTSCLRKQGKAKEVVEIFSEIKQKYGSEVFTPPLLTSIAAAYCDLYEYDNAKKML